MTTLHDYDTVVIGSGPGGLSAALALAQAGQKVLVCEQHEIPGGWTHSFSLEGYRFNTGVHYMGELGPGRRLRSVYEGLGVSADLEFFEINPDGFDHLFIGAERFDIPKGAEAYAERLRARFPDESAGIDRLFRKTAAVNWVLERMLDEQWLSVLRRPAALPWLARSGGALVEHYVRHPLLRAIFTAQAGVYGLPPSMVSAAVHCGTMQHYMGGAYHPRGGGQAIARAFSRALRRARGELRLAAPVLRIVLDGRRAVGVELEDGEMIRARSVVSNADPEMTFGMLIGRDNLSRRFRKKVDRVRYSTSSLSLYLAVDCDLGAMGMDSGNYWFYDHADIDGIYELGLTDYAVHHPPPGWFLSATTLKDPLKMHRGHHQLEVFAFVSYDAFAQWADEPVGNRASEYQQLKERISDRMLALLDSRFPGLRDAVVFAELGTPLTNRHYISAHRGNIYGTDKRVRQSGPLAFRPDTEFDGLFLCGASTLGHGVAYATYSGLTAAGRILGSAPRELLGQRGPALRVFSSDVRNEWPQELQRLAATKATHSVPKTER